MDKPVEVSQHIYEEIEKIRSTGVVMNDYQSVLNTAITLNMPDTEQWLRNNMKIYIQGLKYGMVPEGTTSESCLVQQLTSPKNHH
ncbi:hypothetical protein [Dendrosporobacter sp. 1207_IL3150]|uniref:hypothetical protein n=1 Tax=Dendrosporobacter sp. 1207_IL3150 TaxID=3084054 RepID=UPI002FDA095A